MSRAEKNLAAIAAFGKVDLGDFEVQNFNQDELSLIFEEQYGKWKAEDLQKEAKNLIAKAESERREVERRELEEQIRAAEESGNEALENELLQKMNKLLRSK